MPFQMPLAALLALWVRCNLPLAVALVWITNPLTMPVIFFVTYQFGRWLLQTPPMTVSLELSWGWLINEFGLIWKPLLVGSVLSGLFFATLGFVAIQVFWRWQVAKSWQLRKLRRRQRAAETRQNDLQKNDLHKKVQTEQPPPGRASLVTQSLGRLNPAGSPCRIRAGAQTNHQRCRRHLNDIRPMDTGGQVTDGINVGL